MSSATPLLAGVRETEDIRQVPAKSATAGLRSGVSWATACPRDAKEGDAAFHGSLHGVLWRQLPALLCIARPYHALTLAALSVLEAYIVSCSGTVAGSFYRVLVDREVHALWRTVRLAGTLYCLTSFVQGVKRWLTELVAASSRAAVTAWLHGLYCCGGAFARLPGGLDNPDQRMAADARRWADELGGLAGVFAAAPLKVAFYTHWMVHLTSAPAVALVYLFFALSAALQRAVLGPVATAVFWQERLEGDLRSAHARLRATATEAALCGGAAAEQAALQERLRIAVRNQRRLAAWHAVQAALTRLLDYSGAIIAYCCVALAIFGEGSAHGGSGGQAAERVSNASFAALMLMNSFSQMADASDRLSSLTGLTARVHQLAQELDPLQPADAEGTGLGAAPAAKAFRVPDPAMSTMLEPPHMVAAPGGPLEVSVHRLGRSARAELPRKVPDAPHGQGILAVIACQFASEDLAASCDAGPVSDPATPEQLAWRLEMNRMLPIFDHWAAAVRTALEAQHFWCDAIDPLTGHPLAGSPGPELWDEPKALMELLGYPIVDSGTCMMALHPVHGNKFYPATLLTDAPLLVLQSAIAAVTSSGAASWPLQPLLCLRGFSYSTPGGWLCVKGLSLEVPPRGSVLLEGPSGCGKSTLMRCLAGLHPWQGDSCVLPPPGQVMFLPQQAHVAPGSTLWDQLTYGCTRHASPAQMAAALQSVGLQHLLHRVDGNWQQSADWAGQLSVGEVQRLAFARLLLEAPPLAVLDEATSAIGGRLASGLYAALRAAGVAVLTLSQRDSLLREEHDVMVSLVADGGGGWGVLQSDGQTSYGGGSSGACQKAAARRH